MIDEGPSSEDLERFSDETAHCPSCGEEIWDQAEFCPRCHALVSGNTLSRHPVETWWRQKWVVVLIVAILLAGFGSWIGLRLL